MLHFKSFCPTLACTIPAEVDSGHVLELDKSMENMRFMTNMNDQYMNKSDNKDNAMMM
jgi:hypothetical protein